MVIYFFSLLLTFNNCGDLPDVHLQQCVENEKKKVVNSDAFNDFDWDAEMAVYKKQTKKEENKKEIPQKEIPNESLLKQPKVERSSEVLSKDKESSGADIRFIRLSHGGYKWDDGMRKTAADKNFMKHFQKMTKFQKVRKYGESHPISHLDLYPDDGFPPFVFMTGDGPLKKISSVDIKILREYCLRGGMLFVDSGSNSFHKSFVLLMRKVFPGKRLLVIPDKDDLYQQPFKFSAAPTFWSHGGTKAMGIKNDNRWCVFYHPGDMNDAWKSKGYSNTTEGMNRNALNLGINVVFYAFKHWNISVEKIRK